MDPTILLAGIVLLPVALAACLLFLPKADRHTFARRIFRWPAIARPAKCLGFFALLSAKAIREKIGQFADRAQAIADLAQGENRELTAEEKSEIDGILGVGKRGEAGFKPGSIDQLEADLERAEKLEARQAELTQARTGVAFQAAAGPRGGDGAAAGGDDGYTPLSGRIRIPLASQFRHGQLRAFHGPRADERAFIAGQFWTATLFRNERAIQWCRQHGIDVTYQASLGEGADSSGGFLVPTEVEQTLIDLRETYGVFRANTRIVPMSRDTKSQPVRTGGPTAYFVGENQEITASDKAWGQVNLVARKLAALVRYSNELSEDAIITIGDDLTNEFAYAFAAKEDACGFLGDGTSTYGHVTGVLAALAAGSIYEAIAGNTAFSTLDMADFEAMVGKLPDYPGIQPAWFISKAGWAASMLRLVDAAGGNTAAMLTAGAAGQSFMGYPVKWSQTLNKTLTAQASTKLLVFGDLRMGAMLGNRRGLAIAISADRYLEYDQTAIRGVERFDINVHSRGDATNPGAILALATPAS
jgi:HK97 family phage major capsid protein